MTTIFLIRHGSHALQGKVLVGRAPGVRLSPDGRRQSAALAHRLARAPIRALYSSPLERARETVAPLAERLGLEAEISQELNEIDFGDWTGRSIESLEAVEQWRRFNVFRSGTVPPSGEPMLTAQARILGLIDRLRSQYPDEQVALVSHGDVIKSAIAHYLGLHLDLFHRIEVSPGSLSIVEVGAYGPRVLQVNERPDPV